MGPTNAHNLNRLDKNINACMVAHNQLLAALSPLIGCHPIFINYIWFDKILLKFEQL